jgi:hypothetical protein
MISGLTGLFAGLLHVFSGPDHLAAVAPLSVEHGKRSWGVGFRWGLGHSVGVTLLGLALLWLRGVVPLDWISSGAERLVGVVLIGIGLWGGRKALTNRVHAHAHSHDGHDHCHIHVHGPETSHRQSEPRAHAHRHTVFAVGLLHGLAGGSHILGMLPALAFPSRLQAVAYLVCYGVGTIFAMSSFSTLIGFVAGRCALGGAQAYRALMLSCSAVAVLLGGYWLVG